MSCAMSWSPKLSKGPRRRMEGGRRRSSASALVQDWDVWLSLSPFAQLAMLIQPACKMHATVIRHTLPHLSALVEVFTQMKQLHSLIPGEPCFQEIIQ